MLSCPKTFPLTVCLFAAPVFAQNEEIPPNHKLTMGAYYSEGDYGGNEDTELFYLPLTYELAKFPWVVQLTVPYLGLDGPGDVFFQTGNVGRPGTERQELISERGVGDVIVSATYQFEPLSESAPFIDFTLQLKIPTADEDRGLGTGEYDFAYQLDFYKPLDATTLFSTAGYRQRGKTTLYNLENSFYASFGAIRQLSETRGLGIIYDYREAASVDAYETHELMPFFSWTPNQQWNFMVYSIVGFTESSADRTFGMQISYSLP